MKKITLLLWISSGLFLFYWSCNTGRTSKESARVAALRNEYDSLVTSTDSAWNRMIARDDEKIFFMKRLLQEVSYTGDFDSIEYERLLGSIDKMVNTRYSRESMKDGNLIDQYDAVTAITVREVNNFARTHPLFSNYPLMEELINDINNINDRVLFDRNEYDANARAYNRFLREHKSDMDLVVPEGGYERMALFVIYDTESI